jgi:hypothetical protein
MNDPFTTLAFSQNASSSASANITTYGLQVSFLIFIVLAPELWRSINVMIMTYVSGTSEAVKRPNEHMFVSYELLFMYEWMVRTIFSILVLTSLAYNAKDQNGIVAGYILAT